MISFKLLTEQSRDELLSVIKEKYPDADLELASDNMTALLGDDEGDTEYAVSEAHGCLLFRLYEEEYSFIYPISLSDSADRLAAAMEIRAYVVKEEIPLVFTDVPSDEVGGLVTGFRHINIDSSDRHNRFYTVRVMNELSFVDEIPSYYGFFDIGLTPFTPEDDQVYARLCMDKESNAHWGYDYSEDMPDPEPSYFRESAEAEFYRNQALCLAVRYKDTLVGEATLYYFDLMGGCECAVRILPEFRRRGYAIGALRMLKTLAKRMGLIWLCASVDIDNAPSVAMTGKFLPEDYRDEKIVKFKGKL